MPSPGGRPAAGPAGCSQGASGSYFWQTLPQTSPRAYAPTSNSLRPPPRDFRTPHTDWVILVQAFVAFLSLWMARFSQSFCQAALDRCFAYGVGLPVPDAILSDIGVMGYPWRVMWGRAVRKLPHRHPLPPVEAARPLEGQGYFHARGWDWRGMLRLATTKRWGKPMPKWQDVAPHKPLIRM